MRENRAREKKEKRGEGEIERGARLKKRQMKEKRDRRGEGENERDMEKERARFLSFFSEIRTSEF